MRKARHREEAQLAKSRARIPVSRVWNTQGINQNANLKPDIHTKDKTNPGQRSPNELVTTAEVTDEAPKGSGKGCADLKERHSWGQRESLGDVGARAPK